MCGEKGEESKDINIPCMRIGLFLKGAQNFHDILKGIHVPPKLRSTVVEQCKSGSKFWSMRSSGTFPSIVNCRTYDSSFTKNGEDLCLPFFDTLTCHNESLHLYLSILGSNKALSCVTGLISGFCCSLLAR